MKKNKEHKGKRKKHIVGKVICILQLIISIVLGAFLFSMKLLPTKFMLAVIVILLALFGFCFTWQFAGKIPRILSTILSVILCASLALGTVYLQKANQLMADVGGATYKTDNMIVVVKADDPAETLEDAANYRFGIQTTLDQNNNNLMIEDMEATLGRELMLIEHATIQEEAQALLDGKVEAIIYNEGFSGLIEDEIEDYSEQIKILYQYGIDTVIEDEDEDEKDVSKPFNVYISGIDVSGAITKNSRSDVNIVMTVNPITKQIVLTTTPRDYYVEFPGITGGQKDKLTHAGIYGVDVSMATLEELYDTDIDYYARVNFTSLIKIVDALGGVDVDSEVAFSVAGYNFTKGVNHMNGEQALAFSRERHSFEDGDRQRGKNQEAVLTAILEKAMSPAILKSADKLIASVSDSVETNMTRDEMAQLIRMQLSDGASWQIESQAADGTGSTQKCFSTGNSMLYVMYPDETTVAQITEKLKSVMEE